MAVMSCHYSPLTSSTPTVGVDKHKIIGPKVGQTNMQTSTSRVFVAFWKQLENSVMLLASTQEPQQITKSVVYSINLQEDQKYPKVFHGLMHCYWA
jgi:deoxyinosine 3'endonuclease (endonuclease V)